MKISIDYDNTFSCDPEGWCQVIDLLKSRGHEVICITKRPAWKMQEVIDSVPVPVIGADRFKIEAAIKAGHKIDVWIDDKPETIIPQNKFSTRKNISTRR
jgi:hypothetical protein